MKELNELKNNDTQNVVDPSQVVFEEKEAPVEEKNDGTNSEYDAIQDAFKSLSARVDKEKEEAEEAKQEYEKAKEEYDTTINTINEMKENGIIDDEESDEEDDVDDEDIENELEQDPPVKEGKAIYAGGSDEEESIEAYQGLTEEDEEEMEKELADLLNDDVIDDEEIEKAEKENLRKLQEAVRAKIKPASEVIDLSSFTIANTPISVNSTLDKSIEDEIVYPLYHSNRSTRMKRFFASDIENINPDPKASGLNTIETMKKVYRTFYEHITDANKPAKFEQWLKSTSFMDIKHLYMAAYISAFDGANYITYTCDECDNVWLSDSVDIKENMIEFKDEKIKEKFYELFEKESSTMDKLYTTEIVPISTKYAFSFHDPSIYNVVFESASLPRKITNKYSDMLSVLMYIDKIYSIDVNTKQLKPIALKEFRDSITNTTKVKIYIYSKILKSLTSDEYQTIGKYINKINTREEEIKYYKPGSVCPKCGKKIEREEANPIQLVFQRHSLEAIMNS